MKRHSLIVVAVIVAAAGILRGAVEVLPFRVEETRSLAIQEDPIGHGSDGMKVTFSLKGAEAEKAVRYGELKLEEAVDDKGTNLIPGKDAFDDSMKFQEFSNDFFRKADAEQNKTPALPQVEVKLGSAKRGATKIAHLKGTLSLADLGTIKTIEVAELKKITEKKLEIPKQAGIGITVSVKPDENKEVHSIGLEITGNENALESMEVLDAKGEKVSGGMSSWSMEGGPAHKSLDLDKALDDTMKLVVKVVVDRKVTKVSFDLKDIALP